MATSHAFQILLLSASYRSYIWFMDYTDCTSGTYQQLSVPLKGRLYTDGKTFDVASNPPQEWSLPSPFHFDDDKKGKKNE